MPSEVLAVRSNPIHRVIRGNHQCGRDGRESGDRENCVNDCNRAVALLGSMLKRVLGDMLYAIAQFSFSTVSTAQRHV